jgi:hypothetical protein
MINVGGRRMSVAAPKIIQVISPENEHISETKDESNAKEGSSLLMKRITSIND